MTNRRDKIIEALAGVDLATAHFTWSAPQDGEPDYCVWVHTRGGGATHVVWRADTHARVLLVRSEMSDLADAARKLVA